MEKSESIKELATALAKAQAEVDNAKKTSKNPFFKSTYADLATVLDVIKPVFTSHGLSFVQMPGNDNGLLTVTTVLMHSSGEYISEVAKVQPTKNDPQAAGSAITYLRRYALAAFAGIAQEDDDANSHMGDNKKPTNGTPAQSPKSVSFCYQIWQLDEDKQTAAQRYLEENNAQFDDEKSIWISQKPLKRLEAYQVGA